MSLSACTTKPDKAMLESWQKTFQQALVYNYTDFEGYYANGDVGVAIFSYRLSPDIDMDSVTSILKEQLGDYSVVLEKGEDLVLQKHSKNQEQKAFNEYRFKLLKDTRLVVVMYASLDSEREISLHKKFIENFNDTLLNIAS